ncbi:putative transporter [Hyphodiscus hymeniophilus]|uniref:Transporter n=1 Tax=Hyphodiscus hymeniophilus TaxID=353542 RepID=A0A9P6VLZ4_9HELO|nr:putative transporter [Hyphodiscus hymeniophilus]
MTSTSSDNESKAIDAAPPGPEKASGSRAPVDPTNADENTLAILELVKAQDAHHPIHWPAWKRWSIIIIYCFLQLFVLMTSTSYLGIEFLIQERWGGSTQVVTLGQSMFILGNAVGPAFMGPLSDIGGRKWVYVGSITVYAILNFGCAYARNLPMLIIFMFLCGTAGSTALSNVAGTIADLFGDVDGAGQAMALFVMSANIGPSIGSPLGGWISDNASLGIKWLYLINVIIAFGFAVILCLVPETLPRLVIARAAAKSESVDNDEIAILTSKVNVWKEIRFVATMTFRIMFTEPIVLCLGLYNGFAYGILFLYLDGVFDVFVVNNGLSVIGADLTYLNFVVGVVCMFLFIPVQTWFYTRDRKIHGTNRPEARFITSLVTVWLFPITLLWFAFTSDGKTSYWSPVVAGAVLGFADPLLWLSMLNYVTDSYPNVAGSAIAAFLIPSFLIAAGLAHAGVQMFEKMSTKWAMATIGFVSFGLCALIYFIFFFGGKIRMRSKLAKSF